MSTTRPNNAERPFDSARPAAARGPRRLWQRVLTHAALVVLKRRPGEPKGAFEVPVWVPGIGAAVCIVLTAFRVATGDWQAPAIAGGLLAGILVIYAIMKPKAIDD